MVFDVRLGLRERERERKFGEGGMGIHWAQFRNKREITQVLSFQNFRPGILFLSSGVMLAFFFCFCIF